MWVYAGSKLAGKVDRVPGLFYVVTRFVHLWSIPLLPEASYLVLATPERGPPRGVRIPLSWKSVLLTWLRVGAGGIALLSGCVVLAVLTDSNTSPGLNDTLLRLSLPILCACPILFGVTFLFTRASRGRAIELGKYLGLSPEAVEGTFLSPEARLKELESYLSAHPDALESFAPEVGEEGEPDTSVRKKRRRTGEDWR
jgi:hypothetical protein